jgi:hypothetical protein
VPGCALLLFLALSLRFCTLPLLRIPLLLRVPLLLHDALPLLINALLLQDAVLLIV